MNTAMNISEKTPVPDYSLHWAAKNGDLVAVKNLIEKNGANINLADNFGTTALHLAAMYGQTEVVSYLITHGADINKSAYKHLDYFELLFNLDSNFSSGLPYHTYTPLDLACKYSPTASTFEILLSNNAKSNHYDMLKDNLCLSLATSLYEENINRFNQDLLKMEALAKYKPEGLFYTTDAIAEYTLPVVLSLQLVNSEIANPIFKASIEETIQHITKNDPLDTATSFMLATQLLQVFPTDQHYKFNLNGNTLYIKEGSYSIFSTDFAEQYVSRYAENIHDHTSQKEFSIVQNQIKDASFSALKSLEAYTAYKESIYDNISYAFTLASMGAQDAMDEGVTSKLFEHYQNGQPTLLATGWDGHMVDILFDKSLNVMVIANAGDSCPVFEPGLNVFSFKQPVTADHFYNILTNVQQIELEYKLFYDLELTPLNDYFVGTDPQFFNNCTWNNHLVAEQGLLYLNLLHDIKNTEQAKKISEIWFDDFNIFQQKQAIEDYFTNPNLEFKALGDILVNYHNVLSTPESQERTKLFLNNIFDHNLGKELDNYYKQHKSDFSSALKQFITDLGHPLPSTNNTKLSKGLTMNDVIDNGQHDLLFPSDSPVVVNHTPAPAPVLMPPMMPEFGLGAEVINSTIS